MQISSFSSIQLVGIFVSKFVHQNIWHTYNRISDETFSIFYDGSLKFFGKCHFPLRPQHQATTIVNWSQPYLSRKLLQTSNVDRPLFTGVQVAATNAEITSWTHHTTCQAQWIITEDCFSCSIEILQQDRAFHFICIIGCATSIVQ